MHDKVSISGNMQVHPETHLYGCNSVIPFERPDNEAAVSMSLMVSIQSERFQKQYCITIVKPFPV